MRPPPIAHGRSRMAPKPRMPTSGGRMIGLAKRPPRLPKLVTVKVPERSSSGFTLRSRAARARRSISPARSQQRAAVGGAHHRHDQTRRRRHREPDVHLLVHHDLVRVDVDRGVDQRESAQRARRGQHEEDRQREREPDRRRRSRRARRDGAARARRRPAAGRRARRGRGCAGSWSTTASSSAR